MITYLAVAWWVILNMLDLYTILLKQCKFSCFLVPPKFWNALLGHETYSSLEMHSNFKLKEQIQMLYG